jgi:AcrR family transcriptional regulator
VPDSRPYATMLAKGEDRRQRILTVARRLVMRNGGRGTTLGQIAEEAGVSPAGLLHHFESKEHLLNAVLDARDADDDARVDRSGDILEAVEKVAERFRAPNLIGMFTVLLAENLAPGAPMRTRFMGRYQAAVDTVAEGIRRGQRAGHYRTDVDPAVKAVEVVAFLYGVETSWLLDPSVQVAEVFREYVSSLRKQLLLSPQCSTP